MELLDLTYYNPVPTSVLPNDDFDIQLLFLEAVEGAGGLVDTHFLAKAWSERMLFPYDEYGVATYNLKRGLLPPVSGSFDNPFKNCMGCPIRSELWALLAPGKPWRAAYFAMQDGMIDHGAESIAAEMFFAALESLAFGGEPDFRVLIKEALNCIDPATDTAKAVGYILDNSRAMDWQRLREEVLIRFGHPNFTEAPQNIAFTLFGLLYYPDDFEKALLCTTNCGYDTDCTAATIGAIWGLVKGPGFPERWLKPIGDRMLASHGVFDMSVPQKVDDLTGHVLRVKDLTEARYDGFSEQDAAEAIRMQLQDLTAFRPAPDTKLTLSGGCVVKRDKGLLLKTSEPVQAAFVRTPFTACVTEQGIKVTAPQAGVLPAEVRVTIETRDGRLFQVGLVTPHELWQAESEDVETLLRMAGQQGFDPEFRPLDLMDRSFNLRDLTDKKWLLLRGFFHVAVFDKYRPCVFAESPVRSWLDGVGVLDRKTGTPCIPAPHRQRDGVTGKDAELSAGWHRWDMLFDTHEQIRDGRVCILVAHAYTKQLVNMRFRRAVAGVYGYGSYAV